MESRGAADTERHHHERMGLLQEVIMRQRAVAGFIPQPQHDGLSQDSPFREVFHAAKLGAMAGEQTLRSDTNHIDLKANYSDVVSLADTWADLVACMALQATLGDNSFVPIAEETHPHGRPQEGRRFSLVDGLDGSRSAVEGLHGQYATMVAMAEMIRGEIYYHAAAIVFPNILTAYYASTGKGAWVQDMSFMGLERRLLGKPEAQLRDGQVLFNMQYHPQNRDPRVIKMLAYLERMHKEGGCPKPVVELPNSVMGLRVLDQDNAAIAVIHDSSELSRKQEAWDKGPIEAIALEVEGAVYQTLLGERIKLFEHAVAVLAANDDIYQGLKLAANTDGDEDSARIAELSAMSWEELRQQFPSEHKIAA